MTHQLVLDLPDHVYQPLADEAKARGLSPAELAAERLAAPAPAARPGDGLRAIRGIVTAGPPDLAARHHEYLGQALADEARGDRP